jgi:hypothetical protein
VNEIASFAIGDLLPKMVTYTPPALIVPFHNTILMHLCAGIVNWGAVMNDIAFNSGLSAYRDLYGIAALTVAAFLLCSSLFLLSGDWPYGYHEFLRIAAFALSAAVVHREWRSNRSGWLLFAGVGGFMINPVLPLKMDKDDWSFANAILATGYAAYGLQSVTKKVARLASIAIFAFLVVLVVIYRTNLQIAPETSRVSMTPEGLVVSH